MNDIIQQSKMLLNAIKHEYKALESRGAIPGEYDYDGFELWLDSTILYGDGSEQTRHAIEALSEESYFYGVQVWMGGRWIMMLTSKYGTSLTHKGCWFESKHEAEECAATWSHDTPTRIVRQRRSPVEAVNE